MVLDHKVMVLVVDILVCSLVVGKVVVHPPIMLLQLLLLVVAVDLQTLQQVVMVGVLVDILMVSKEPHLDQVVAVVRNLVVEVTLVMVTDLVQLLVQELHSEVALDVVELKVLAV